MRQAVRPWIVLLPSVLAAQAPQTIQRAVNSITPEDVRRRIGILADDSMRGRDTPSRELEEAASYVAAEFRRFGLAPGGDRGSFLQRFSLDRLQLVAESSAAWTTGAVTTRWRFGPDVLPAGTTAPAGELSGAVLILTGQLGNGIGFDSAAVAGKVVILLSGPRAIAGERRFLSWRPAALVASVPDSLWRQRVAPLAAEPVMRDPREPAGMVPALLMRGAALLPLLARAGLDLEAGRRTLGEPLRATPVPDVLLHLAVRQRVVTRQSAPNVIGILEGSDPRLQREYVFFTAHMDHVGVAGADGTGGCQPKGADSICNGADDDASGTTAVLEAAEAFVRLQPRPRRSLVFMTVSGEEKGLWGSSYFVEHPTIPLADVVAELHIDMVGRNWKDTIVAIGKEHSDLGATLDRVAAAHPELHMQPIDDLWPQENFYFRSDHYNFARKGIPILFFFNGVHPDYHQVSDSPDKIDAEKEARIVKLVFYLGLELANARERPRWNPDSYRRIVEGAN